MRVIFNTVGRYHFEDVALRMVTVKKWAPVYWISRPNPLRPDAKQIIRREYPEAILHDYREACLGIHPKETQSIRPMALDEKILIDFAEVENLTLKMMDRIAGLNTFDYNQRIRLYHRELAYWFGVVNHLKPDSAVFGCRPHEIFDFILMHVCRYRNIETVAYEDLDYTMPGLWLSFRNNIKEPELLNEVYYTKLKRSNQDTSVYAEAAEKYMERANLHYEAATPALHKAKHDAIIADSGIRYYINRLNNPRKYLHYFLTLFKRVMRLFVRQNGKGSRIISPNKNPEESINPWGFENTLYTYRARRYKRKLRDYYEKKTDSVDLSKPFVYLALHYQPESSTSPRGGYFVHQRLVIDMLSRLIPSGWRLYVKEHRSQFAPFGRGEQSRTTDLYDDASALPNVELVPLSYSPFDLIDNSRAVATVTGTTAWEAVCRGKPAIIFGNPWFRNCEGVFYTPNSDDLRDALHQISLGYKVDTEKVKLFLLSLMELSWGDMKVISPPTIPTNPMYSNFIERVCEIITNPTYCESIVKTNNTLAQSF